MTETLFVGIRELLTLSGAHLKAGRHIQEEDLSLIPDGAIHVRDGVVQWVGRRQDWQQGSNKIGQVDLQAQTVLPAFLECHTHSLFGGNRHEEFELRQRGVSYSEISQRGGGILSTVRHSRAESDSSLIESLKARVKNFRLQGVSTIEVKTGYGLSVEQELRHLRLIQSLQDERVIPTFLGPHAPSPEHDNLDSYLDDVMRSALPIVSKEKLARRADIFIESGFFSPQQARRYFEALQKHGLEISVHAEQLSWSGGIEVALDHQAKSVDHCVNMNDQDLVRLSQSDTTVVLLPSADFYLDISYPPARALIEKGGRVALSTDFNPGSSPSQSLELCSLLARIKMKMTLPEIFSAWTVGPSYVLGLENEQGSLDVGKQANFSVWNKPWSAFFYNFEEIQPQDLYLDGKRVAFT